MPERTFRVWRGDERGGDFAEHRVEVDTGMVILDVIHRIQANQATDLAVRYCLEEGGIGLNDLDRPDRGPVAAHRFEQSRQESAGLHD